MRYSHGNFTDHTVALQMRATNASFGAIGPLLAGSWRSRRPFGMAPTPIDRHTNI